MERVTLCWTYDAVLMLAAARVTFDNVERAIHYHHDWRQREEGQSNWQCLSIAVTDVMLIAICEHPFRGERDAARVMAIWRH
jgi:hypothetical protein